MQGEPGLASQNDGMFCLSKYDRQPLKCLSQNKDGNYENRCDWR